MFKHFFNTKNLMSDFSEYEEELNFKSAQDNQIDYESYDETDYFSGEDEEFISLDTYEEAGEDVFQDIADDASAAFINLASALDNTSGFDSYDSQASLTGFDNQFYGGLANQLEASIDHFSDYLERNMNTVGSDASFDNIVDAYDIPGTQYGLFGWVKKKVKKLFKKVKKVAKKVWKGVKKFASKFNFVKIALNKLKRMLKPFLRKIIGRVLKYIPARLRPLAKKALRRFGITADIESFYGADAMDGANPNVDDIIQQFNQQVESITSQGFTGTDEFGSFDSNQNNPALQQAIHSYARSLATDGMNNLQENTENFVTAVLTAIRIGIRIIGRKRVIRFLAKQLAKLIKRWVGRRLAYPISKAVVKGGFRILNLEVPDGESNEVQIATISANMIGAAAVQLEGLSDETLESPAAVSATVNEVIVGNLADQFVN